MRVTSSMKQFATPVRVLKSVECVGKRGSCEHLDRQGRERSILVAHSVPYGFGVVQEIQQGFEKMNGTRCALPAGFLNRMIDDGNDEKVGASVE
jgi:hypothetical protein